MSSVVGRADHGGALKERGEDWTQDRENHEKEGYLSATSYDGYFTLSLF